MSYIDEHATATGATRERTWAALVDTLWRQTAGGERLARLLGCDPAATSLRPEPVASGDREAGAPPAERFEGCPVIPSQALASTHAAFPGLKGRVYKPPVIGTRAHVVATRRILRAVARRARELPSSVPR